MLLPYADAGCTLQIELKEERLIFRSVPSPVFPISSLELEAARGDYERAIQLINKQNQAIINGADGGYIQFEPFRDATLVTHYGAGKAITYMTNQI